MLNIDNKFNLGDKVYVVTKYRLGYWFVPNSTFTINLIKIITFGHLAPKPAVQISYKIPNPYSKIAMYDSSNVFSSYEDALRRCNELNMEVDKKIEKDLVCVSYEEFKNKSFELLKYYFQELFSDDDYNFTMKKFDNIFTNCKDLKMILRRTSGKCKSINQYDRTRHCTYYLKEYYENTMYYWLYDMEKERTGNNKIEINLDEAFYKLNKETDIRMIRQMILEALSQEESTNGNR